LLQQEFSANPRLGSEIPNAGNGNKSNSAVLPRTGKTIPVELLEVRWAARVKSMKRQSPPGWLGNCRFQLGHA